MKDLGILISKNLLPDLNFPKKAKKTFIAAFAFLCNNWYKISITIVFKLSKPDENSYFIY